MSRTYINVEVDVSEFDTEVLARELKNRKNKKEESGESLADFNESIREIYYALKFGNNDRALDLMKTYVCDQTGFIL